MGIIQLGLGRPLTVRSSLLALILSAGIDDDRHAWHGQLGHSSNQARE